MQRRDAENAELNATAAPVVERDGKARERDFDAEARRRGGRRGERNREMGGRRVPGGVEKVKGLRSAETAEDGGLRAGAEGVSGETSAEPYAADGARGGMGWEPQEEECPQEWGHGSLKGYATGAVRRLQQCGLC